MEDHMYNPMTILTLQKAVRTGDFACFRRYSAMVDDELLPHTLRGLLGFRFDETKAISDWAVLMYGNTVWTVL